MKKIAYGVIAIGGTIALLVLGKSFLIPFVYGIVLCFIMYQIKNLVKKVPPFGKKIPGWVLNITVFAVVFAALTFMSKLIVNNIAELSANSATYQTNISKVIGDLSSLLNINMNDQLASLIEGINYRSLLQEIADGLSSTAGNVIMVCLYAAFIISEESSFEEKIKKLYSKEENYNRANALLGKIGEASGNYIRLKTYLSLLTGVVGYIFLMIVGVDGAFFWAFLLFALNYIPTIGSLLATIFPAVFSLLQFGEIGPFIIILVGLGVLEWLIGNIIEPRIMGKSLNLSPLVTILALVIWGQIWGLTGMLLSTPITVIMVIIFSQFKSTKQVAILLSENGDIEHIE